MRMSKEKKKKRRRSNKQIPWRKKACATLGKTWRRVLLLCIWKVHFGAMNEKEVNERDEQDEQQEQQEQQPEELNLDDENWINIMTEELTSSSSPSLIPKLYSSCEENFSRSSLSSSNDDFLSWSEDFDSHEGAVSCPPHLSPFLHALQILLELFKILMTLPFLVQMKTTASTTTKTLAKKAMTRMKRMFF
jgi:hypothetical protein